MPFIAFPPETLRFLADLRSSNSHEWFRAHRREYDTYCLEPAKAFVLEAGRVIQAFVSDIRAEPRVLGSIFRIKHDNRYKRHDRPYKDHLDFWFWEGERKRAVSGLFVRISPDFVGIGAGCHRFDPERLRRFRSAVVDRDSGPLLDRIVQEIEVLRYPVGGLHYKRLPKGVPAGPRPSRFLRFNALYVHVDEPASLAVDPALLPACKRHWRALAPLHRWITRYVQSPET
jgi:uncharacterized protein (TIGR02453 family)